MRKAGGLREDARAVLGPPTPHHFLQTLIEGQTNSKGSRGGSLHLTSSQSMGLNQPKSNRAHKGLDILLGFFDKHDKNPSYLGKTTMCK